MSKMIRIQHCKREGGIKWVLFSRFSIGTDFGFRMVRYRIFVTCHSVLLSYTSHSQIAVMNVLCSSQTVSRKHDKVAWIWLRKSASLFQVMAKAAQRHKSVSIGNVRDIIWSRHLCCMRLAGSHAQKAERLGIKWWVQVSFRYSLLALYFAYFWIDLMIWRNFDD